MEPCINGQVAASGAYFGQDVQGHRRPAARRAAARRRLELRGRRTARRARRSTPRSACWRPCSNTNWPAGAAPEVTEARLRGQEYLLERRLFRRRSTGEVDRARSQGRRAWTRFAFPTWWHYDVLRGTRVPAPRRRRARRARGRGDRPGRVEARRRRPVAARDPVPRRDAGRDGRGRGPAEPVEHTARLTGVGLVFSRRIMQNTQCIYD